MVKKFEDMFSGVDRIPACDGQTDGQTSCDSAVHAIAYMSCGKNRQRVTKIVEINSTSV